MTDDSLRHMGQHFPKVLIPILSESGFGSMVMGLLMAYEQVTNGKPVAPVMEKALLSSAVALRRDASERGGWLSPGARKKAEAAMESTLGEGGTKLDDEQRTAFVKLASLYCTSYSLLTLIGGERHGKTGQADIALYKHLLIDTLADETRGAMDRPEAEKVANDYIATLRRLACDPAAPLSHEPHTRVQLSPREHVDEDLRQNVWRACRQQLRATDIGGIGEAYRNVEQFFARKGMSEPDAEAYMSKLAGHVEDIERCEAGDENGTRYAHTKDVRAQLTGRLHALVALHFHCSKEQAERIVDASYLYKAAFDMAGSYTRENGGVASMHSFTARPELRLRLTDALADVADKDTHVPTPILRHTVSDLESKLRAAVHGRAEESSPPPQ